MDASADVVLKRLFSFHLQWFLDGRLFQFSIPLVLELRQKLILGRDFKNIYLIIQPFQCCVDAMSENQIRTRFKFLFLDLVDIFILVLARTLHETLRLRE